MQLSALTCQYNKWNSFLEDRLSLSIVFQKEKNTESQMKRTFVFTDEEPRWNMVCAVWFWGGYFKLSCYWNIRAYWALITICLSHYDATFKAAHGQESGHVDFYSFIWVLSLRLYILKELLHHILYNFICSWLNYMCLAESIPMSRIMGLNTPLHLPELSN